MAVSSTNRSTSLGWEAFKSSLSSNMGNALKERIKKTLEGVCDERILGGLDQVGTPPNCSIQQLDTFATPAEILIKDFKADRAKFADFSLVILCFLLTVAELVGAFYGGAYDPVLYSLLSLPVVSGPIACPVFFKPLYGKKVPGKGRRDTKKNPRPPFGWERACLLLWCCCTKGII